MLRCCQRNGSASHFELVCHVGGGVVAGMPPAQHASPDQRPTTWHHRPVDDAQFWPVLSTEAAAVVEAAFDAWDGWSRCERDVDAAELLHVHRNGAAIHTTVEYVEPATVTVAHVHPRIIDALDLVSTAQSNCAVRVVLLARDQVARPHLEQAVDPGGVRLTLTHRYHYKSLWRFELTRSWHGDTMTDAERRQLTERPQCFLTLHLADPFHYDAAPPTLAALDTTAQTVAASLDATTSDAERAASIAVALSLLHKITDFARL
jgi:hypothetical protein